jgi:hypothetical protein
MPNYSQSTITQVAAIGVGLKVETPTLLNTGWGAIAVWPLFNVFGGRVQVTQIIGEVVTTFGAQATLIKYYYTPTGGAQIDLSAISLTASALAVGTRILAAGTIGGATTFSGIGASMWQPTPYVIGEVALSTTTVAGKIGVQSTTAAQLSGSARFGVWYFPLDDGAYIALA